MFRYFPVYLLFILTLLITLFSSLLFAQETEPVKEDISVSADSTDSSESMEEDDDFGDEFDEEFAVAEKEVFDPLSGYNRSMTGFNDGFYVWVVDPVARGYRWVLPEFARRGVRNFFNNLLFPVRFVNNTLQFKVKNAGEEMLRFSINSTVGIFGLWDPAKLLFDLEAHEEDFGQTLGYYGVGGGFHVVIPFLGPSNLRDMFSLYPDQILDPNYYVENRVYNFPKQEGEYEGISKQSIQQLELIAVKTINRESLRVGEYANLKKDAYDLYPFLRDVYEQNRAKLISE